jgi:hypothetical protein
MQQVLDAVRPSEEEAPAGPANAETLAEAAQEVISAPAEEIAEETSPTENFWHRLSDLYGNMMDDFAVISKGIGSPEHQGILQNQRAQAEALAAQEQAALGRQHETSLAHLRGQYGLEEAMLRARATIEAAGIRASSTNDLLERLYDTGGYFADILGQGSGGRQLSPAEMRSMSVQVRRALQGLSAEESMVMQAGMMQFIDALPADERNDEFRQQMVSIFQQAGVQQGTVHPYGGD